jgi:flavin reductase (DIM6/NTAB) family NADH-FMN oxidoreductase RutF
MKVDPAPLSPQDVYRLLTGIVVPRPIAWVTTRSPAGVTNLAPFSCFTFVSSEPPMIGINVGLRNGELKDTARNILDTGEFVVNIGDETMIRQIHLSAVAHPPDMSETELLELETADSVRVAIPRLAQAPINLECRLREALAFGDAGTRFIVGEVLMFHIRDGLCERGKIDTLKLRPVCRLAGQNYASLGQIYSMESVAAIATGPTSHVE